jgi:hypothetical protein
MSLELTLTAILVAVAGLLIVSQWLRVEGAQEANSLSRSERAGRISLRGPRPGSVSANVFEPSAAF